MDEGPSTVRAVSDRASKVLHSLFGSGAEHLRARNAESRTGSDGSSSKFAHMRGGLLGRLADFDEAEQCLHAHRLDLAPQSFHKDRHRAFTYQDASPSQSTLWLLFVVAYRFRPPRFSLHHQPNRTNGEAHGRTFAIPAWNTGRDVDFDFCFVQIVRVIQ